MKGRRLFDAIINEKPQAFTGSKIRGRSIELIETRNQCILYRFYYYSKLHRMRYEDVIECLSKEFFLSSRTVIDVISNNSETVRQFKDLNKNIKDLKQMYAFLNWNN